MKFKLITIFLFFQYIVIAQNFHDTQGKLEISNSGQAVYTLPIALPPSLMNVGPVINITYSSGQLGGIAGQGWTLNSISSIHRVSSRIDIDGYLDGMDFDDNDKLALDGQRLLLVPGTGNYWSDGSVYKTEIQSNFRIELKGSGESMYFIVTSPDGSKTWYGNDNAKDLTTYYIKRFEDVNGNFMTYQYTNMDSNNVIYLDEINFSANVNGLNSPLNKIKFTYKNSIRTEKSYVKGLPIIKSKILDKIEVYTNNLLFRKYQLTHKFDSQLGYEKVEKLQEFNGSLEPANPVFFEYNESVTTNNNTELVNAYNDFLSPSSGMLSGDFDGDGFVDFYNNGFIFNKLFQNTNTPSNTINAQGISGLIPITTLSLDNKLNQFQSIVNIEGVGLNQLTFRVNQINTLGTALTSPFSKTIQIPNSGTCWSNCPNNTCDGSINNSGITTGNYLKTSNQYLEGDFNGDGISEILIIGYGEHKSYNLQTFLNGRITDPNENCVETITLDDSPNVARILDMNPFSSTIYDTKGYCGIPNVMLAGLRKSKKIPTDFNGDGKTDILIINEDKTYRVIGFKQLTVSPWVEIETIGQGTIGAYEENKNFYFGDFNGDGKSDLLIPIAKKNSYWTIYYSNPKLDGSEMFESEQHFITEYNPDTGTPGTLNAEYQTQQLYKNYYVLDVNKDGKSDLVVFNSGRSKKEWWQYHNFDTKWSINTYVNNIGNSNASISDFTLDYASTTEHYDGNPELPFVIAANFKNNGANKEMAVIRNGLNTVTYINFTKNVTNDALLKKVVSSDNAIINEITYKPLNDETVHYGTFYTNSDQVNYPFVDLKRITSSNLVFQLKSIVGADIKYQDFSYNGFIVNLNGIGTLGFNKFARSNWYRNSSDKKIWSVTLNDALYRNAVKTSYTKISNNNTFSFTPPSTLANGTINTANYEYTAITDSDGMYTLLLNKVVSSDLLTNVFTEKTLEYFPSYNLVKKATVKNLLGNVLQGTTTSTYNYENNSSPLNYFIGRLKEKEVVVNAYQDTIKSFEKNIYAGNKIIKTRKKGNTSAEEYLDEEYEYDNYGNITKKTLSASGISYFLAPRVTEYTYDATGRFIETSKDIEGLVSTNVSFHPLYGLVTESKSPFDFVTKINYDNWGKQIKVTDYLNKSIQYTYTKNGTNYEARTISDDGSESFKITDVLGRETKVGAKNIDNTWTYKLTEYDYLGRKYKESEPYKGINSSLWNFIEYDDFDRVIKTTSATGLVTNISYVELTTNTSDGIKSKSNTKNANGHVVTSTDNGGIINYTYFADGNLKTSNFEGNIVEMKYDAYGRKKYLSDPSAGVYTYEYDIYGQIKKETTPKGYTEYFYDNVGKLTQSKITGLTVDEKTDITTTFTYNPTTKLLTNKDVINTYDGNTYYTYQYDLIHRRLTKETETNNFTVFTKELEYDAFGRIYKELKTAKILANNKSTSKKIRYVYNNGVANYIYDDASNALLFASTEVNARNQNTKAAYGNQININNSFDDYGFPQNILHTKSTITTVNNGGVLEDVETVNEIVHFDYSFDIQRGNLLYRNSNLFNYPETFQYDNLDRLTQWGSTPEVTHQNTFSSNVEGFTSVNGGVVGVFTGKLKISATAALAGGHKLLYTAAKAGTKINVSALVNKNGTDKIRIIISEQNPSTNVFTHNLVTLAQEGTNVFDYVIKTNSNVYLRLDKSDLSTDVGVLKTFFVDNLTVKKIRQETQTYDNKGRITENKIGTYNYTISNKLYRNSSVSLSAAGEAYYSNSNDLNVTYNAFKSPIKIQEGTTIIDFSYNSNQDRSTMFYGSAHADRMARTLRKHYSEDGTIEIKHNTLTGAVEFLTYIGGDGYTAPVVLKSDGTTQEYLYLHRDHQGSIVAISNQSGNIIEKRAFDAWGNITYVQDGSGNNLGALTVIDRGYTGHEHLQSVNLIHMNGRLYDPMIHRFLQPDNYVQDLYNTQNYNRYGYVLNNPLKYTDPSGEFIPGLIIGVGFGIATYVLSAIAVEAPITLQGVMQTSLISLISAGFTGGIGVGTSTIDNFFTKAAVQAISHGMVQGGLSELQGGKFCTGFYAASLGSIAASVIGKIADSGGYWDDNCDWSTFGTRNEGLIQSGTLAIGAIMGGVGARLNGDNFWEGAATGLIVAGLNHTMHKMEEAFAKGKLDREVDAVYGSQADSEAPATDATLVKMKNSLPTLKRLYPSTGNRGMYAQPDMDTAYDGVSIAKTFAYDTDNYKTSTTTYFKKSFASHRILARTMLHEFGHGVHYFNGDFNRYRKNHTQAQTDSWKERYAFKFAFDNGGVPYLNDPWYIMNK